MASNGFIKLYRSMLDWQWYTEPNTMRVFLHLLLKANHKKQKWRGRTILSGQTVTSRAHLAEELRISEQSVRSSLNRLKSTSEITIESTSKYSLVTICKWASYQSKDDLSTSESTSEPTNEQPAINQQSTTNKNDKNDKNDKNTNIPMPVITFLLNDKTEYPIYEERITEWKTLYPAVDIMQELRNIKAWCIANPQNRKTKNGAMRFVNSWLGRKQNHGVKPLVKTNVGNFKQRQYSEEQLNALTQ